MNRDLPPDDYNDTAIPFSELSGTYDYYIRQLMTRELGFINLSRRGCDVGRNRDDYFRPSLRPEGKELPSGYGLVKHFGPLFRYPGSKTMLMVNHEYSVAEADKLVRSGSIDLVTFARAFIYNPVSLDTSCMSGLRLTGGLFGKGFDRMIGVDG
jgi:2,4-dienoyl-CoA reductase-like NADH-dependent reductase (Old Yellow Enzyme family)